MTVFPNPGPYLDELIIISLLQRLDGGHHLNQVCWGIETSRTCWTGQSKDQDFTSEYRFV